MKIKLRVFLEFSKTKSLPPTRKALKGKTIFMALKRNYKHWVLFSIPFPETILSPRACNLHTQARAGLAQRGNPLD